jgi:hypothetical protein
MLSIFDRKEFEPQPEKKPTLDRLQHVLEPQRHAATQDHAAAAAVAEPPPRTASAPPPSYQRKPAPQPPETPHAPVAVRGEREQDSAPAEFQQFAEQFTHNFLEGLAHAVREICTLVAEERRRLEALHGEVTEVSQRLGSLVKGQQELASKLGKAEDAVSVFSRASHATQDLHEQLEKRIELQAGVIRTLHSSLQAREERLDRVLASFQALHSVSGEVSPPSDLPENL